MAEDKNKSWYKLGNTMGLIVVSLEEEEEEQQTEEDKEVERIYQKGKEMKRAINRYVDHIGYISTCINNTDRNKC